MQRVCKQAGFTLIEVMLFLAITGLLFLIGFWGTSFQIRNVRFTDAMRTTHSYLQKQYGLVSTGANPRDVTSTCTFGGGGLGTPPTFGTGTPGPNATAGDEDACILLGKLIKFSPDSQTITSYYVVGHRLPISQPLTGDDITDLINSGPAISPQAVETFTINWGTTFFQPSLTPSNLTQGIAFLRSPSTGKILTFAFNNNAVTNSTGPSPNDVSFRSGVTSANLAKNSGYCFKDGNGHQAIIKLGYDQRSDAMDITFENFNADTDCVRSK